MIVANWPDMCPRCRCREFIVSTPETRRLAYADGSQPAVQSHRQEELCFECRDSSCRHAWRVRLLAGAPQVCLPPFNGSRPLAVVTESAEQAAVLTALPEDWTVTALSTLLHRGALRVQQVVQEAESKLCRTDT